MQTYSHTLKDLHAVVALLTLLQLTCQLCLPLPLLITLFFSTRVRELVLLVSRLSSGTHACYGCYKLIHLFIAHDRE